MIYRYVPLSFSFVALGQRLKKVSDLGPFYLVIKHLSFNFYL